MASRSLFKGSPCKAACRGHRAGYNYARSGGGTLSKSSSFNAGMRIYLREMPVRVRSRR
jgi:hypothetical protein